MENERRKPERIKEIEREKEEKLKEAKGDGSKRNE